MRQETSNTLPCEMKTLLALADNMIYGYTTKHTNRTGDIYSDNFFSPLYCENETLINFHELNNEINLSNLKYDITKICSEKNSGVIAPKLPIFCFRTIIRDLRLVDINHLIITICNVPDLQYEMFKMFSTYTHQKYYMFESVNQKIRNAGSGSGSGTKNHKFLRVFIDECAAIEIIKRFSHIKNSQHKPTLNIYSFKYTTVEELLGFQLDRKYYELINEPNNIKDTRIQLQQEEKIYDMSVNDLFSFTKYVQPLDNPTYMSIMKDDLTYSMFVKLPDIFEYAIIQKNVQNINVSASASAKSKKSYISKLGGHDIVTYNINIPRNISTIQCYDICHVLGVYLLDMELYKSENKVREICEKYGDHIYIEYHRDMIDFEKMRYSNYKNEKNEKLEKIDIEKIFMLRYMIPHCKVSLLLQEIHKINFNLCIKELQDKYISTLKLNKHNLLMNELIQVYNLKTAKKETRNKMVSCLDEIIKYGKNADNHKLMMQELIQFHNLKTDKKESLNKLSPDDNIMTCSIDDIMSKMEKVLKEQYEIEIDNRELIIQEMIQNYDLKKKETSNEFTLILSIVSVFEPLMLEFFKVSELKKETRAKMAPCLEEIKKYKKNTTNKLSPDKLKKLRDILKQIDEIHKEFEMIKA